MNPDRLPHLWRAAAMSAIGLCSGCNADRAGVASPTASILGTEPSGQIAFTVGVPGVNSDIGLINADGSGFTRLTSTPEAEVAGGWSGDGNKFFFTRNAPDGSTQVWRMDGDGSNQVQLTTGPGIRLAPYLSPDGARLVWMEGSDWSFADAEIVGANADGSNQVNLTNNPGPDLCPRWSPDGQRISFSSIRHGTLDVFTMAPDGTALVRVTSLSGWEICPSWSPDGTRLGIERVRNAQPGIYVINVDGTGAERVHSSGWAGQPWWSPDGEWLVFNHQHGGDHGVRHQLYLVRADGSEWRRLTYLDEWAQSPQWRP